MAAASAQHAIAAVTLVVFFAQDGDFTPATVFTTVSLLLALRFPLAMLVSASCMMHCQSHSPFTSAPHACAHGFVSLVP
jgi:hypothetical protein